MKTRIALALTLALAFTLPLALMTACRSGLPAKTGAASRPQGPCDIYAAGGTPCVAAHSTTRALSASYTGPLYQLVRQSDGRTLDIGVVRSTATDYGGYADAAAQDAFCEGTLCNIKVIYDQSGKGNHFYQAPPGTFKGPDKGGFNTLPIADMAPMTISGHKAYGVYIMPGMGFRNNNATGIAINDEPEGIYYVVDGTHFDSGCCFDYGNSSANGRAVGTGTMETVYFGTATAWGSGAGDGPWIMADFEAGLFTGYNAKKNAGSPTIDSWRFVTAVVDGGGGNKWDLRGGNAQQGSLKTFYSGSRPGSSNNASYFPMHKKGGILLGNGGDNGNGSAGTFYEGVMTTGFPSEATTDAVQANIVAAKYDIERVSLSRVTTFTPGSSQNATVTFRNTTGETVTGVKLSVATPNGWASVISGTTEASQIFGDFIAEGASVNATFKITAPNSPGAGFLTAKVEWTSATTHREKSDTSLQRVRNAFPIKINEVRFSNQFVELYNASDREVDISRWSLISTPSQWAPVKLATVRDGTKVAAHGFYLFGLSSSGLANPSSAGATAINVRSAAGFEVGQKIDIDGESRTITGVGTAAAPMSTVFIPVSSGPWLKVSADSKNLPVASAAGFEMGQKIGIDVGGNYEVATVTAVGKAATQTTLSEAATAGATRIKIAANSDVTAGDTLIVGAGGRKELATVKSIISVSATRAAGGRGESGSGGEVELTAPLKLDHMLGIDISDVGTGISFSPVTKFPHLSGDAVQALGNGITLDKPLDKNHEYGAPVINSAATAGSYQGPPEPNQWFGNPLSASAGSIVLLDAGGKLVVDAMVFGSRQSGSSANGTIASPELATLEGNQSQGGCIVVVAGAGRGGRGAAPAGAANRSVGLVRDGADTDNNCSDFQSQNPTPGASNQAAP
jgi:non-reducing end alpha-L-arabinofuranosidase